MTTTATATRTVERPTTPTPTITPVTAQHEPGARLLKKLYATRPALATREPAVVRP
jgi:hypothetical protein